MIAAGLQAPGGEEVAPRVAELGKLANVSFDAVATRADTSIAAGSSGILRAGTEVAWIGCDPQDPTSLGLLRGPFAFVAAERGKLLLGRGRLGGHPIYYGRDRDGALLACSRLGPLVELLARKSALDPGRIGELLVQAPGTSATLYQGIRRLRSGQLVSIDAAGERSEALPALPAPATISTDIGDVADQMFQLIEASIGRSIGSAKKIGIFVGGLDSSALLAAVIARARGASDTDVKAITLHFAGPDDDRRYVRDMCRELKIEPIRFKPAECAKFLLRPTGIDASPLVTPQWPWNLRMSQWAAEYGIEVVLSGEGGDHLFDGDPSVFANEMLQGHVIRAVREVSRLKGLSYMGSTRSRLSALLLRPALRQISPRLSGMVRATRIRRRLAEDFGWAGPALRPWLARKLGSNGEADGVMAVSDDFLDHRDALQQYRLFTGCRFSDPYLDDELVSFVDALPRRMFFHGGYRRGLFRFAFRHLVPDSVRLREDKSGFQNALAEIFEAGGGEKLAATYSSMSHLADLHFIEPREFGIRLEQLVRNPREGTQWQTIWPALAMEAFLSQLTGGPPDDDRAALLS